MTKWDSREKKTGCQREKGQREESDVKENVYLDQLYNAMVFVHSCPVLCIPDLLVKYTITALQF